MTYGEEYFRKHREGILGDFRRSIGARHWELLLKKHLPAYGRVLDIGFGLGHLLKRLEPHFETYGLDISNYAIKQARQVLSTTKLYQQDATDLSMFVDEFFDGIVAIHLLEHLDSSSLAKCLAEIHRVLKPQGMFVVGTPNLLSPCIRQRGSDWYGFRDKTHVSLHTPAEWEEILRSQGFKVLKVYGDWIWEPPLRRIPEPMWLLIKAPFVLLFSLGVRFPVRYSDGLNLVAKKVSL